MAEESMQSAARLRGLTLNQMLTAHERHLSRHVRPGERMVRYHDQDGRRIHFVAVRNEE